MNEPKIQKSLFVLAGIGVFLSFYGIYVPYSYWFDELYSVIDASSDFSAMFSNYILKDVHPPLYQIILKLWIFLFSDNEISTRMLSFLFSISSIVILIHWSKKILSKASRIITISFFLPAIFLYIMLRKPDHTV